MNGFILCVVRTYGISRIFGDGIFILESDFSDFSDFYKSVVKLTSHTQVKHCYASTNSNRTQPTLHMMPSNLSYGTTYSGSNSVLIVPDVFDSQMDATGK